MDRAERIGGGYCVEIVLFLPWLNLLGVRAPHGPSMWNHDNDVPIPKSHMAAESATLLIEGNSGPSYVGFVGVSGLLGSLRGGTSTSDRPRGKRR